LSARPYSSAVQDHGIRRASRSTRGALDDREDAFGHAIIDWLDGGTEPDIVERDDGFIETGAGPEVYLAPYEEWPRAERQAMRSVRGDVVDVGCGAGRVAVFLQQRGHSTTGIDVSPLAIRACRARDLERAELISMDDLDVSSFDTIVLLGNNFGLFRTAARARRLLQRWGRAAPTGSRIIVQSMDPHRARDALHGAYRRRNRRRGRMPGQFRLRTRYRQYVSPWADYLFVSRREMRAVLRGTGWRVERFFGSDPDPLFVALLEKD
jgi:SAM-dependent methyltransferase